MKVSVGDAVLYVERQGTGPDLVMLHGIGLSSARAWQHIVPALSDRYTVLTYDFRGHGRSTDRSGSQGIGVHAADLEALLDHFGIESIHLLGFSFGGLVAQRFALDHPRKVRSLVLVSTTARLPPEFHADYRKRAGQVEIGGMESYVEQGMERTFSPPFIATQPELASWYREQFLANRPDSYAAAMLAMLEHDASQDAGTLRCPTLVIGGDADASPMGGRVPAEGVKDLHQLIPGSELVLVPGAKHYVHLEQPGLFVDRLSAFLGRVESRSTNR